MSNRNSELGSEMHNQSLNSMDSNNSHVYQKKRLSKNN